MIQNLLDGQGVFNAGNDAHWALTFLASLDVDMEYPFQALGPGHGHVALGEAAIIRFLISLLATLAPACGCDQSSMFAIGSEHAVESSQIDTGFGHQGSQPGNEIQRFEDHMSSPIAERSLEFVAHLASGCQGEALFCNGRPGDVATEPLQLFALISVGGHASV